jgi:molecular chaperone DnaK
VPQIAVTFDIDANGIVSVSARDKVSGKEQAIKITPSTGLSKEEIDRMIFEAKRFTESDRKLKELAELRNRIQGHVATIARSFGEYGWLLDSREQELAKESIQKARTMPDSEDDLPVLKELLSNLEAVASKLSAAMFNMPDGANVQHDPELESEAGESAVQRLMKSALEESRNRKT